MTANGVWAGKLMWGHVEEFLGRARELPGLAGADLWNALDSLLDDPALIFVTRRDKVYQAVSLWRAVQTQAWRAGGSSAPDDAGVYHFKAIDHLVRQLDGEERAWQSWFAGTGLDPITVQYEELDSDPRRAVTRVLGALGLHEVRPPWFPTLPRQRDQRSAAWVERYERDRQRVTAA
jgi:LPS sulfotransferase NodH